MVNYFVIPGLKKNLIRNFNTGGMSAEAIISATQEYLALDDIHKATNKGEYTYARDIAVYIIFETNKKGGFRKKLTLDGIGTYFPRKKNKLKHMDHSQVILSSRKIKDWVDRYEDVKKDVDAIINMLCPTIDVVV